MVDDKKYWNNYYANAPVPQIPSQFAVFIANEFPEPGTVIELGCGNGRDSQFFAANGWAVHGIDSSSSSIELCKRTISSIHPKSAFVTHSLEQGGLPSLFPELPNLNLIYARFFVHAISHQTQTIFLQEVKQIMSNTGAVLALEFRTDKDQSLSKQTEQHYRRFIAPTDFIADASSHGLKVDYFVQGFGFAKYKNDDAHVVRLLLSLR